MATVNADVQIGKIYVPVPRDLFSTYFRKLFFRLDIIDTTPPYFLEGKSQRNASLLDMGEFLGLVNDENRHKLITHGKRINDYHKIQYYSLFGIFAVFFVGAALIFLVQGFNGVTNIVNTLDLLSIDSIFILFLKYFIGALLGLILFYLYIIVPFSAGAKIIALMTDRYYAESITLWTAIILTIQLWKNDQALDDSQNRQALVYRLNDLAKGLIMYSRQFQSKNPDNRIWIRTHFNNVARFVHERERWIIAPKETTLNDLRRDFGWLTDIFISGRFGNLEWPETQPRESLSQQTSSPMDFGTEAYVPRREGKWTIVTISFLKIIFGIAAPIGILLVLTSNNGEWLNNVQIDRNMLGTIAFGWTLVGIDKLFNLGATPSAIDVAKGFSKT